MSHIFQWLISIVLLAFSYHNFPCFFIFLVENLLTHTKFSFRRRQTMSGWVVWRRWKSSLVKNGNYRIFVGIWMHAWEKTNGIVCESENACENLCENGNACRNLFGNGNACGNLRKKVKNQSNWWWMWTINLLLIFNSQPPSDPTKPSRWPCIQDIVCKLIKQNSCRISCFPLKVLLLTSTKHESCFHFPFHLFNYTNK